MISEDYSYFQSDKFKKELKTYENMLKTGKSVYMEADVLTDIAEFYIISNQRKKADDCIDYALALHPNSADPLIFLTRQRLSEGFFESAEIYYERIEDKNDLDVILLKVEMTIQKDDADAAEKIALQAQIDDEDKADFNCEIASIFYDYTSYNKALKWINKALEECPDDEEFLKLKADILIASGKTREPRKILKQILDANPYYSEAWHSLAKSHFDRYDIQKAHEDIDFALAINENDVQALTLKAMFFMEQKNYEAARKLYTRLLELLPRDEMYNYNYAMCLNEMGQYDEALVYLKKAEKLTTNNEYCLARIYSLIIHIESKKKNVKAAFEYIDKLMPIFPLVDSSLFKGHALACAQQLEEAKPYFDSYLQMSIDKIEAYKSIALALLDGKYYEQANEYFDYIVKRTTIKSKEHWSAFAYQTFCRLMMGDFEVFEEMLPSACIHAPSDMIDVLGDFFPDDVAVEYFPDYIKSHPEFYGQFKQ